jgi:hypothetical protein
MKDLRVSAGGTFRDFNRKVMVVGWVPNARAIVANDNPTEFSRRMSASVAFLFARYTSDMVCSFLLDLGTPSS